MKIFLKDSILLDYFKKFKSIKRGYYSLIIVLFCYFLTFFNPLIINNKPLIIKFNNNYYFPAIRDFISQIYTIKKNYNFLFQKTDFGNHHSNSKNFRKMKMMLKKNKSKNWIIMPLYPYSPNEILLNELQSNPPIPPTKEHIFGIDNQGRDIFARIIYGFQISISFALLITFISYVLGTIAGATLGYFGGKLDLIGLRVIEIISTIPLLFLTMIMVSFIKPSFGLLVILLIFLGGWIGISYYIRAEFLREKNKEYVFAAISMGASPLRIIFKHILPNSLTPIITFTPFSIVGYITTLVSLDFLGLGLLPPTPSWGELLNQGVSDINNWWLILFPLLAIFFTLLLIIFIGESVREAIDPKSYSRLK